jgi:minor extracellular protease Epr
MLDIGARTAWNDYITGLGVNIAVLDTGVWSTNTDFGSPSSVSKLPVNSTLGTTASGNHGTGVAGVIGARKNDVGTIGVAPDAKIISIKVCSSDTSCSTSDVISGINLALQPEAKVRIINMSIYTCNTYNSSTFQCDNCWYNQKTKQCDNSCADSALALQVKQATDKALVVVAAGNFVSSIPLANRNDSCKTFPAVVDGVISVAAVAEPADPTNPNGERHLWNTDAGGSYFGDWVHLAAPGMNVLTDNAFSWGSNNTGTSFAAPFVSGAAALLISQALDWAPEMVRTQLLNNAIPMDGVKYGRIYVPTILIPGEMPF